MRPDKSKAHIEAMSPEERIANARHKLSELKNHVLELITTNANNEVISFTSTLSSQIPQSRAAHAFNNFQRSMFLAEIARVCALWDPLDFDKVSVPTIFHLIDDQVVMEQLLEERKDRYKENGGHFSDASEPPMTPEMYEETRKALLQEELARAEKSFARKSIKLSRVVPALMSDHRMESIRQYRHHFVAHNIGRKLDEKTERELPFDLPKMGHPRGLLKVTCAVANGLDDVLNDSYFGYGTSFKMAARNAKLLWENTTFSKLK